MKIAILGGGPGGLYCGLLLKKVSPGHDITVYERNPPDATYGWGVVFSEQTLTSLEQADRESHEAITGNFIRWEAIDVFYRDQVLRSGGHTFSGVARKRLLQILQKRCARLGVKLVFHHEVDDLAGLEDVDLLIAADGVNSLVRRTHADVFKPSLSSGRARYAWFGVDLAYPAFTFIFRESEHGLFQVHAYPFDQRMSTFIVECAQDVWRRAGLDQASEDEALTYCSTLFAPELRGRRLLSNRSSWLSFVTVTNEVWSHVKIVLLGDAAHTAHFSIGSGTRMAMEDAIALARAIDRHSDLEKALTEYELERRPAVERLQALAEESADYFENVSRYTHLDPTQFAFHLLTRSGRITYDNLRQRDPLFVHGVSRWFIKAASGGQTPADHMPPMLAPFRLRSIEVLNRTVLTLDGADQADEGTPGDWHLVQAGRRALSGAGLVLTDMAAVSAEGRISPGSSGLYRSEHIEAWQRIVAFVHSSSPAKIGLQLGHAGRRGATRFRQGGLDRPLPNGAGWPLLSASALAYSPLSQIPAELDGEAMDRLRRAFVQGAQWAAQAGFDLLELHFGHGYLLASFLSPLTNRRGDSYGGPLKNRLRLPLEVFQAVREVWPEERPLSVCLSATDWQAGGFTVEEAVEVARRLGGQGCDLIHVVAGQTTPDFKPEEGRGSLLDLCERVRNEARLPTLTGAYLTTPDSVNTVLAAGRADLCVLDGWLK